MRTTLSLVLILAAACSPVEDDGGVDTDTDVAADTDTTADTDDPTGGTVELDEIITVTEPAVGDFTCVPDDGTSWWTQQVDPSCVESVPLRGKIEDFQTGDAAVGMNVEIWFDDHLVGDPDVQATSDVDGIVTGGDVPTCSPFASRATNPSDPGAPPAIQMHWSESHKTPMDAFFNSVDSSTLGLMSALLGTTPDTTRAFAAGTIYGCDAGHEPVEGVQVILRSPDGTYTADQTIHYFVDEFPSRTQPQTSEDGLFLIVNVPPGDYTIEAYAVLAAGEAPTLIAKTETTLLAGALTVADVYSGNGTGVVLPESCTAPCESFPE
jgi:hypothetical protein